MGSESIFFVPPKSKLNPYALSVSFYETSLRQEQPNKFGFFFGNLSVLYDTVAREHEIVPRRNFIGFYELEIRKFLRRVNVAHFGAVVGFEPSEECLCASPFVLDRLL